MSPVLFGAGMSCWLPGCSTRACSVPEVKSVRCRPGLPCPGQPMCMQSERVQGIPPMRLCIQAGVQLECTALLGMPAQA